MTKAISTTTTKHPHLSIVQFFKEPLQLVQRRSEIMISYPTTVKHRVNLFYSNLSQTTEIRPTQHPTRLTPPTRRACRRNRRSAEEVRIIDTHKKTSRKKKAKLLMSGYDA